MLSLSTLPLLSLLICPSDLLNFTLVTHSAVAGDYETRTGCRAVPAPGFAGLALEELYPAPSGPHSPEDVCRLVSALPLQPQIRLGGPQSPSNLLLTDLGTKGVSIVTKGASAQVLGGLGPE